MVWAHEQCFANPENFAFVNWNKFGTYFVFNDIQAIIIIYLNLQGSQVKSLAFIILYKSPVAYYLPDIFYCFWSIYSIMIFII